MMLNDDYMTDVIFDVQGWQFKCHKLILSSCESRLKQMVAESPQVKVDDIAPDTFQAILKALYTDYSGVTDSNVFKLMHAAKAYELGDLEQSCSEFIRSKLSEISVCHFTSQALQFNAKNSLKVCLNFFKNNTLEVLNTAQFLDVPRVVMETFHKNKSDECSELRYFIACFNWAKAECKRKKLKQNPDNLRMVLGDKLVHPIKYKKTKMKEFFDIVRDSNVSDMLLAAEMFELGHLECLCSEFIRSKLSVTRVCFFTSQALHFNAKNSLKVCLDFFKQNTLEVLRTLEFMDTSREVMETFLENKSDGCSELRFFKACFNWAKAECTRKNLARKHDNLRMVMGEKLVNGIKYEDMEMEEFLKIVVSAEVLTLEEIGRHVKTLEKKMKVTVMDHERNLTTISCRRDATIMDIKRKRIWHEGKQSYEADSFTLSHKGKTQDDKMILKNVDPMAANLHLEVDTFKIILHDCSTYFERWFVLQVKDLPDPRRAIQKELYPGHSYAVLLGNNDSFRMRRSHFVGAFFYNSENDPPKAFHPGKMIYHRQYGSYYSDADSDSDSFHSCA